MFKHEKEVTFNARTFYNAFMKKFIILATLVALISTFTLPVFAAEKNGLSYSGESYNATVKYGLNMRDKNNNIISYLGAGTSVKVLGVYSEDSSRVVIEYGNKVGTVLGAGLKKSANSTSEFKYSGSSYYATVKYGLNLRDKNNNLISYLGAGTKVYVLGIYTNDSSRVVIEYNGTTGTVLKSGLTAVSSGGSGGNVSNSGNSYYAVTTKSVNLNDSNGKLICCLPKNSLICVKGVYSKNKGSVSVSFYGIEGNVSKDAIKEVKDAIFVSIYRQKVTVIRNGKLIAQSDCVTGKENVRDTRRRAFKVEYMQRNRTLRGTNYKGVKYAQPVEYWVRFYGNTGFHSASYRSSFGGTIYKTNGSNGCVNLPYDFAKTLYNNAYIGMPVYVA